MAWATGCPGAQRLRALALHAAGPRAASDLVLIEDTWQMHSRNGCYRGGPLLMIAISGIDMGAVGIQGKGAWTVGSCVAARQGVGSDGRVEIDSNTVDRTVRTTTLNRKNALFANRDAGAEHWAVIASLVETSE